MRCARATRRSAAVAAVAAAAPTTSLCLDGFTAIHRRDYYPVSPLRLLCTTTRPVHDTSRSIRLTSPFPLSPLIRQTSIGPVSLSLSPVYRCGGWARWTLEKQRQQRTGRHTPTTMPHPPRRRTELDAQTHTNTYLPVTRT